MSIYYEVELPENPRWCRVQAFCPNHTEDVLVAEWSTVDGDRVAIEMNAASKLEFIGGWMPTETDLQELRAQGSELGLMLAQQGASAAPADEDDEQHFRYQFGCTKPSCAYDAKLRGEQLEPAVQQYVREMWAAGIGGAMTLPGRDVESFLSASRARDTT